MKNKFKNKKKEIITVIGIISLKFGKRSSENDFDLFLFKLKSFPFPSFSFPLN